MRNKQLTTDVAGPDSDQSQFNDPLPHMQRQRTAVHEKSPQLVDPSLACKREERIMNIAMPHEKGQ